MANENKLQAIISHCKEYGFVFPSSEIYDGLGAVYDYGQNGAELKKNIKEIGAGLDFILKLQPVEYQMLQGNEKLNFGFIAQDIEQLLGSNNNILTIDGDANRTLGLRYTDFIAPLVKAIQEQQKQIEELKQQNKEIVSLKAELEAIKALLKK